MQEQPYAYLRKRVRFDEIETEAHLTFITFDYGSKPDETGMWPLTHIRTERTTVVEYQRAMMAGHIGDDRGRADFLRRVREKAQSA